jgi:hypothetical protein
VVTTQQIKDESQVRHMLLGSPAVNKNVIKKHQDTLAQQGKRVVFMAFRKVAGAPDKPNAITRNSYWPECVWNAVFGSSPERSRI